MYVLIPVFIVSGPLNYRTLAILQLRLDYDLRLFFRVNVRLGIEFDYEIPSR